MPLAMLLQDVDPESIPQIRQVYYSHVMVEYKQEGQTLVSIPYKIDRNIAPLQVYSKDL